MRRGLFGKLQAKRDFVSQGAPRAFSPGFSAVDSISCDEFDFPSVGLEKISDQLFKGSWGEMLQVPRMRY